MVNPAQILAAGTLTLITATAITAYKLIKTPKKHTLKTTGLLSPQHLLIDYTNGYRGNITGTAILTGQNAILIETNAGTKNKYDIEKLKLTNLKQVLTGGRAVITYGSPSQNQLEQALIQEIHEKEHELQKNSDTKIRELDTITKILTRKDKEEDIKT